jgi:hypothetical protein
MAEKISQPTPPQPPKHVASAMAALKPFLDENPLASIVEMERPAGTKILAIERPWGDRSIALVIPENIETFAGVLNNLLLPTRYSALWHRDTKDFEILWTAFRLSGNAAEIVGRNFSFKFRGKEYNCGFSRSSDSVFVLAKAIRPLGQSETGYRSRTKLQSRSSLRLNHSYMRPRVSAQNASHLKA